jgi:excisionase family DNA binding protein
MSDRLLSIPEVAERLNTPESTLRFWRHRGQGPKSARVGRRVMYRETDLERWIAAQFDKDRSSLGA